MSSQIWTATSIQSVCHAFPVNPRETGVNECLKKTSSSLAHSPAYVSRHASSLAMPQEDSMCGDGPTVSNDCIDKKSLLELHPEHKSRHASSLAVPQEDSMCGDGPTIPELIYIRKNDKAVQHSSGLSTTDHALAASIALRSFGTNASLASTRSSSQHRINQSEPHTLVRRLASYTSTRCIARYRPQPSHAKCCILFAR